MSQELEKEIPPNDNELKYYYGIHYQPSTLQKERSHQASGCNNVGRRLYYSPQSSQITRTISHINGLFPFQLFWRLFGTYSSNVCTHGCNCHICTITNL
jgi:hypothetical protein